MPAIKDRACHRLIIVGFLSLLIGGCTTLSKTDDPSAQISADPMEGFNRKVNSFNLAADKAILRPVASAYDKTLPKPAKSGISNFFSNLGEPLNILNNLLQGKIDGALKSTYRFTVNSTIGLFGLIDVADKLEVEEQPEDFGQTLAAWGVKPGPYIVMPFFGPSNLRDGVGFTIGSFGYYPINEISDDAGKQWALSVLNVVDGRAALLDFDSALEQQPDQYLFLKSLYETNRLDAIYDGAPPESQEEDDLDDF